MKKSEHFHFLFPPSGWRPHAKNLTISTGDNQQKKKLSYSLGEYALLRMLASVLYGSGKGLAGAMRVM